jgi:hypothetical protein
VARPTGPKTKAVEALMDNQCFNEAAIQAMRRGDIEHALECVQAANALARIAAGEVDRMKAG